MKIKLLKNSKIGGALYKEGANLEVTRDVGKELVRKKKAEETNFVTSRERIAPSIAFTKAKDTEYPQDAASLVDWIATCSNATILEQLKKDKRKTVASAADSRLAALS